MSPSPAEVRQSGGNARSRRALRPRSCGGGIARIGRPSRLRPPFGVPFAAESAPNDLVCDPRAFDPTLGETTETSPFLTAEVRPACTDATTGGGPQRRPAVPSSGSVGSSRPAGSDLFGNVAVERQQDEVVGDLDRPCDDERPSEGAVIQQRPGEQGSRRRRETPGHGNNIEAVHHTF